MKFKPRQSDLESGFYLSVIENGTSDTEKATDGFIQKCLLTVHNGPETVLDMPIKPKWEVGRDGIPNLKKLSSSWMGQMYKQELPFSEVSAIRCTENRVSFCAFLYEVQVKT